MPRVRRKQSLSQSSGSPSEVSTQLAIPVDDGTAMLALIQELIPLGLKAVQDALAQEVNKLAGPRYSHQDERPEVVRWGAQKGPIRLADAVYPHWTRHAGIF